MKKEIIRDNEINLSHNLSGKMSLRKEKPEQSEFQTHKAAGISNLKIA